MPNMPCKNPQLCGVQSHRPGTNAVCLQAKAPTSRERALGLQPPKLATSDSGYTDKEVRSADNRLAKVQREHLDIMEHEVEIFANNVRSNEKRVYATQDATKFGRDERIQLLSQDAYVREHADAITQADLDEDFSAKAEATQKLQMRLEELDVPSEDVPFLAEKAADRVKAHWQETANFHAKRNPAGTLPEWEPFTVEKGLELSHARISKSSRAGGSLK